jgi:hypothetical protein
MRPDWETVITPVVDYALTRGEIVTDKIVLFGYSLGGFLVARAAAFEHRVAALILDDGIYDFHAAFAGSLPPFIASWIEEGRDDVAVPVLTMLTAANTQVRWGLRNGLWVFGADSFADLIRRVRLYTLDGIAHKIVAPTLILDPENDQYLKGQPQLGVRLLLGWVFSNFSKILKTSAAGRDAFSYSQLYEVGTSRDWARRTNASGRGVAGDDAATAGSRRSTRRRESTIAQRTGPAQGADAASRDQAQPAGGRQTEEDRTGREQAAGLSQAAEDCGTAHSS